MTVLSVREREVVAAGAAIGAGCRPCTQYHVKAALKVGLTNEALTEAVEMAGVVKRMAGEFFHKDAERALGGGAEVASPAEAGSCLQAPQPCAGAPADTGELAASAPGSCC